MLKRSRYVISGVGAKLGAIVLSAALPMAAQAMPVNWGTALNLQGIGPTNPVVLVGFNPQPEPPPHPALDLSDRTAPLLTQNTESVNFQVLFAIGDSSGAVYEIDSDALAYDRGTGILSFDVNDKAGISPTPFHVEMTLFMENGFMPDPGSIVGFNPQPEPPAIIPLGGAGLGFDFIFGAGAPANLANPILASLQLQVFDANNNAIAFAAVPEPATGALLLGALGVAGWRHRRRTH